MRIYFFSLLAFACSVLNPIFAQNDSLGPEIYTRSAIGVKARPFIEYQSMISAESSTLATSLLWQLRSATTYDQSLKNEIFASLDGGLRLGALQNNEIRFAYKGHRNRYLKPFAKESVALFHRGQTSIAASEDLVKLILNGNKATAGIEQDLSDFAYEDWLYTGLQFQFGFLIDTLPVSIGTSLILGHYYQSANSGNTTLFTAENGTEINFAGSYDYNSVSRPAYFGIAGVGLAIDIETEERWGKHQLNFKAQDLGFISFSDGARLEVDSSFSFTGINVSNIFTLQESVFQASLDSTTGVLGDPASGDFTRLMPFMVQLEYEYHLAHGSLKSLYLQGRYRYLKRYLPRVEVGARWQISKNKRLTTALNMGGFNSWGLSTEFDWQIKKNWQLGFGVSHVNTMVVQSIAGGSSAFFSLRYYL